MSKKRKETKMSSKPKVVELQAAPAQPTSEETRAEDLFNKQKAYFASDATKTYKWRIDQLNRLTRMLKENFERLAANPWNYCNVGTRSCSQQKCTIKDSKTSSSAVQ